MSDLQKILELSLIIFLHSKDIGKDYKNSPTTKFYNLKKILLFCSYGDDVPNMIIRIFLKDFKTTVTEQVPKYDGLTSLLGKDIFSFHFDRLDGFIGR